MSIIKITAKVAGLLVLFLFISNFISGSAMGVTSAVTERISISYDETEPNGVSGTVGSQKISDDGRYVVFTSYATNIVPGYTSPGGLYLRDRDNNTTALLWGVHARDGVISGDGKFVAYSRCDGVNYVCGLYVHSIESGTDEQIDITPSGNPANLPGQDLSGLPSISNDGRYISFYSAASNLVSGDTNSKSDIFVRDRVAGITSRVSVATDGTQGNGDSTNYSFVSGSGRYVAFSSTSSNLVSGDANGRSDVFLHDLQTGITERISIISGDAASSGPGGISSDGRYVAFSSTIYTTYGTSTFTNTGIYVRDRISGTTTLVSGSGDASWPTMSSDGRYVEFTGVDSELVPNDRNSVPDIFVRDQLNGTVERVSINSDGVEQSNSGSNSYGAISGTGRYVVFTSSSNNLVPGDIGYDGDVFVRDRGVNDELSPTISASVLPEPNGAGWNNTDALVSFICSDEESGIATCPNPVTVSQEGAGQIIEGTATDNAGNSATASATLNIDKTPPTISSSIDPTANVNGWNNSDVTVSFDCDDALSGIATCTNPVTVSTEGANQSVSGTAVDVADNTAATTTTVNIDKTVPTIDYSVSPAPNSYGWNNSDVTVSFTCNDGLSGIDTCPEPITLTSGAGQIIEGTATDKAGNSATASVMVNIDKAAPTVSNLIWSANPLQQGQDTTLSAAVSEALSGLASVTYSIDGAAPQAMTYDSTSNTWQATFGAALTANTYAITITATDQAGNVSAGLNDILAVYNASNGYVTGHAKILPTTSDVLPIALDTSNNPTKLVMGFTNVMSPASGSFEIDYAIKNKQNEFSLESTTINWVVVQDSTHASILGHGDLTTWVNGVETTTQNMTVRIDIVLGTNGDPDTVAVKLYNPGDDPNYASPAYTINDQVLANGSNLRVHQ
jgi:hypothetical protein